jgi:hypothetical protein
LIDGARDFERSLRLALETQGISIEWNALPALAAALEDELWTRTESNSSSKIRLVRAALPLSPIAALLQNQIGVLGTAQENDYGKAIEEMYAVGRIMRGGTSDGNASDRLRKAMVHRLNKDSRLSVLNDALLALLCRAHDIAASAVTYDSVTGTLNVGPGTPRAVDRPLGAESEAVARRLAEVGGAEWFGWFYDSWYKLTSPDWSTEIPIRRWIDWLVAVIRLVVGSSYLGRWRWLMEAAQIALGDGPIPELGLELGRNCTRKPLVTWPDRSGGSTRSHNIHPRLRKIIVTGAEISTLLQDSIDDPMCGSQSLEDLAARVRSDEGLKNDLYRALSSPQADLRTGKAKTPWFTIKSAFLDQTRSSERLETQAADHYALMKPIVDVRNKDNKVIIFDPSSEVVALIATLACDTPDGTTTLGRVEREFSRIGFRPSPTEMRLLLECAGLCRSEADASAQITVVSALRTEGFE